MLKFENEEYLLHDTIVDNIELTSDGLILYFHKGVYTTNHGSIVSISSLPCKMHISIQNFNTEALYQHIEIIKLYRYTYKEKSFKSFIDTVQKYGFRIDVDYYSSFANAIMIEGISNNSKYFFKITEIQNIKFVFDN